MTDAGGVQPRVIRVFVSSTFRDMQLEREELIKRVFPQVRRLCESRGVAWSEIDLRWGVTDEQKAEGAVLPICLAEIERSRPYFVGMLGQRYGWVPDEIPAELARRLGWLTSAADRSVTELEILHGVLNDSESAGHAFFYLRDPAWVDAMAPGEREMYVDGPEPDGRLDALKARLRGSPFPVRDYATPTGIGAVVLADLIELVERLYPEASVPDPLDREAAQHAAHAASRFESFVARPELQARLDAHAAATDPPLMVTGPAGVGASALVANWAAVWRAAHPGDVVVEHYVGSSAASADWTLLVDRLVGELVRGHGLGGSEGPDGPAIPDDAVGRRAALESVLVRAAASGRRTVLVIDGVDQLDELDGAVDLAWLPKSPPPGVRIVLTAPGGPAVEVAAGRGWPLLTVPPLSPDERRQVAITFLAPFAKALDDSLLDRLADADGTANALYLRVVLDELRQHGDHFTLGDLLERLLAAASVDDLIELVLTRYERDYEQERPGLVGDAMTAIWAARRGLAEAELLDLLGSSETGEPLPRATWSPLFLAAEEGLVTRSGYLAFGTEHHRRAVADRYCKSAEAAAAAHARLAAYFAAEPIGPRVVDELPWQLLQAGDVGGLVATLADLEFLDAAIRRSYPELRRLWARAEAAGYGMVDAYRPVIADPAAHAGAASPVARLLTDAGHRAEAIALHRFVVADARQRADGGVRLRGALVNLGSALWTHGELEAAAAPMEEAATLARSAGDRAVLLAAVGNLALVHRDRGDLDTAAALFDEEEALCRAIGDPALLQACLGNRAQLLRQRGDIAGALALMVEQESLCRSIGDRPGTARALAGQAAVHADRGEGRAAIALFDAHVALCRDAGDLRGLAEGRHNQAVTLGEIGELAAADEASAEAEALARQFGDLGLLARVLVTRAGWRAAAGQWADAERLAREGELVARSGGAVPVVPMALGIIGIARREQGDLAGAASTHAAEQAAAAASGDPGSAANALSNLAAVDIATGQLATALARYAEAEPVFRRLGTVLSLIPLLTNRGQVHAHLGDVDRAVADYADAARLAASSGQAAARHQALTLAIELLYASGRPPPPAQWEELADACRAVGDDAGLQRAVGEQALLLIGAGELDRASALLDEQQAICRRIGHQAGLAACVGNRAIVLRQRGDPAGALACIDEQLALVRATGDQWALVVATANRGDTLGALGRIDEGLAALRDARQAAATLGVAPMVAQLDQLIATLAASRNY